MIKISSSASSIALATSSKYPLALTYLKDEIFVSFIFFYKKKERKHILWQSKRWKPLSESLQSHQFTLYSWRPRIENPIFRLPCRKYSKEMEVSDQILLRGQQIGLIITWVRWTLSSCRTHTIVLLRLKTDWFPIRGQKNMESILFKRNTQQVNSHS